VANAGAQRLVTAARARTVVVLATLLAALPSKGAGEKLRVEVLGLGGILRGYTKAGDLKKNVLSVMSIDDARKEKDLTERRIRQLHDLAPDEIKRALEPYGYYKPVIDAKLVKEGDTWVATYSIEAGPEMRVTDVDVTIAGEGASDGRYQRLVNDFPLKPGDVLASPEYEAGKKSFEDLAARIGYLDAGFSEHRVEVNVETYTSAVHLHLDTGPLYFFGTTIFEQDFLDERVVRGYVQWKEGQPFDINELLLMQGALSDATYFSRVEVEPREAEAGPDRRVPIHVTLLPAKPIKFHFGLGYGTDTGPRATSLVQFRRLNKKGHRAETQLTLSSLEKSFGARYMIPGYYPRTDVLTYSIGYAQFRPGTSKSDTALVGVDYTRSRGRWRESIGLLAQREQFTVGLDKGTSYLLIPNTYWERVRADDRLYTHDGYKVQLEAKVAVRNVVSDVSFFRPRVAGKLIKSLRPKLRLITRAEVGYITVTDFHKLPPRLRYFAGGDQSVRGYRLETLGERDASGAVIGGEVLRTMSVEFDQRVSDWLGGLGVAVFVDAGNATRSFTEKMKKGAGFGVRWRSPIGMVRADMAFGLDLPNRPIRFHLNIGPDL
jgi:translocation and assembly module TamA